MHDANKQATKLRAQYNRFFTGSELAAADHPAGLAL